MNALDKDIQDFLYYMIHSKSLTREQQTKRDKLLVRGMITQNGSSEEKKSSKKEKKQIIHSPKDTAILLSLFNRRYGLKYLTHNYDKANMTYDEMLKNAKSIFEENKKGKNLPSSLIALINNFMYGKEWLDVNGKKCVDGYGNPLWLSWSLKNGDSHPITDIGGMEKTIQRFRHTIRIVAPDLDKLTRDITAKYPSLKVSMVNLDKADFYTNVFVLKSRLAEMIKDMYEHENQQYDRIEIVYEPDVSEDFFIHRLRITQFGSFSTLPIEAVLRKYKSTGGFFYENAEKLQGYCNWSVESLWDGKPFRWNILNDTVATEIESIDINAVKGFTHILTFYQKY